MKEPVRWASGISFVVLGVILSVVGISVVRFTEARADPWLYIALVIGTERLGRSRSRGRPSQAVVRPIAGTAP